MAGYSLLYYSVIRVCDGYEVASGFADSTDTPSVMIKSMKRRVDAEIADGATFDGSLSATSSSPLAR